MDGISASEIESLVRIWSALHKDIETSFTPMEKRYFHRIIFDMDEDLVARLLAVKLARARHPAAAPPVGAIARTGSRVHFAVDGREERATLIHGYAPGPGRIGVGSRFGAALVGLHAGQAIAWPRHDGSLVEVRLLGVSRDDRAVSPPVETMIGRRACASG